MLIPKGTSRGELEIKKSRFLYEAHPVSCREDVISLVSAAREKHPQANHVVHAFVLGHGGDIFGMSDDREPRNTAGRPALEVLKGSGITNTAVLVIRYFGGTKLGTGGLVKAYGDAAREALKNLPTEPLVVRISFFLTTPYPLYEQVRLVLLAHRADILEEQFTTEITMSGLIPEDEKEPLSRTLLELSSGNIILCAAPEESI